MSGFESDGLDERRRSAAAVCSSHTRFCVALGLGHHDGVAASKNSTSRRFRQSPVISTDPRLASADVAGRIRC